MKTVSELRAWPRLEGGAIELRWRLPSAQAFDGSQPTALKVVRREHMFPRDATDGIAVYEEETPVDRVVDTGLRPLRTYYYTVFTREPAGTYLSDENSRVAAFATADLGGSRALYDLLPQVHRTLDRPPSRAELAAADPELSRALAALAPELREQGQLQRFMHVLGAPLDLMRSFAEGLGQLHDAREARPEFLRALARFVGWELDGTLPIFQQRNEIASAPRLYRRVGTVPSLREIVNRYTGWNAQVAESAESLLRANVPAQFNVFAVAERDGEWRGADDASRALGIRADDNEVFGTDKLPAILVTPAAEPFALRNGMQLSVTVDDRLPAVMRLRSGDFADIGAATAKELAAALNRGLTEATATALDDGRVELRSHTSGPDSRLSVDILQTSLVTLEGAPRGRLAVVGEPPDRVRLFYGAFDPVARWRDRVARAALGRGDAPDQALSRPRGEIRLKTLRNGEWGDSQAILPGAGVSRSDPAAARLASGRLLLAWVETAASGATTLRYSVGATRTRDAARLVGRRRGPFQVEVGSRLLFRGNWPRPEGFEFAQRDLPAATTAAALAAALNARLKRIRAVALPDETLAFETIAIGGDERLELDLAASTGAAALGFEESNRAAAGSWGDDVDWAAAADVSPAGNLVADLQLAADTAGGAWLLWAEHAGAWRVRARRFDASGWGAPSTIAASTGGDREPCAAFDASGQLWVVWSRRTGVETADSFAFGWSLRRCALTATGAVLAGSDQELTTPRAAGFDREPGIAFTRGRLRVFYASDVGGGTDRWSLEIDPATGTATAPVQLSGGADADRVPTPVLAGPQQALWLLYRSDRSVSASQLARRPLDVVDDRVTEPATRATAPAPGPLISVRLEETGTLRRFAGSTSVMPRDFTRMAGRRRWDDLTAYTSQGVTNADDVADDALYTRGTVVLYLNRLVADSPLTQQTVQRLQAALAHFLPINVRLVVVLAPRVDIERFYRPGADIVEDHADTYPFIESLGLEEEGSLVALPDWVLLRSFAAGPPPVVHRSADPTTPESLRARSYQRDLDPNTRWSGA